MFTFCLLILSFLISGVANAERFQAKIYDIGVGQAGEAHLIKLTSGQVAFIKNDDEQMMESLQANQRSGDIVEIELDINRNIVSAQSTNFFDDITSNADARNRVLTYKTQKHMPTLLENRGQTQQVFGRLNTGYNKKSQCYNRAHVWAYEEFKRHGLKSDKAFVFFSDQFIRRTNFWWWFHVAPLLTHRDGAWLEQRVLDHQFSPRPQRIQEWLGQWVKGGRPCEVVRKYSDYAEGQKNDHASDCYVVKTSMYFWQPRDIDNYEKTGSLKTDFIPAEVEHAYGEAFYGNQPQDL